MLSLTSEQLEQISKAAQAAYPEECCGLLLGQGKTVLQVWPTMNAWISGELESLPQAMQTGAPHEISPSRCNRFMIDPEAMLAAQKYARQQQLAIIGIYHSHPDVPAIPSEYDRAIAWEMYSYVILSVQAGRVAAIRSWVLDGDRLFQEEPIQPLLHNETNTP